MIEHVAIPDERIKKLKHGKGWETEIGKFLEVNIELREDVVIEGDDVFQVLRAKEIFKAYGRGFDFLDCLDLLDDDYVLSVMEMKDFVGKPRDRVTTMKGRVIGEGGSVKRQIEKAANVKVCVYGKTISVIGKAENTRIAEEAIAMILFGSKHNKVYRFLSEHKVV